MSSINPEIFRAYDVRGIYPTEINEEVAHKISQALVSFLNSQNLMVNNVIVVGRDCRLSSPSIFKSFSEGVIRAGVDVVDIGEVSTDTLYFALNFYQADSAVMITASHNPPEYIGVKMVARGQKFICGDWGISEIKKLVLGGKIKEAGRLGNVIETEVLSAYLQHILGLIDLKRIRPLKVVVDAGNGMGGKIIEELAERAPVKLFPLYFKPDGRFPNHLPNPLIPENIKDLQEEVAKRQASFGLALDGDADRTIFVDEKGEIISGDMIVALFAQYFLKKEPEANIVYNLTCSKSVPEIIKESGGRPIKTRTGHAFMKEAAKKHRAIFGGEISGHLYFQDVFYAECGGLVFLLMLKILSETKEPLSKLIKKFKRYHRIGEVNFEVEDREGTIKKLAEVYKEGHKDWLDGLTVDFNDWWFNARPSNTEPLLRIVIEAKEKKKVEEELKRITGIINKT